LLAEIEEACLGKSRGHIDKAPKGKTAVKGKLVH